MARDALRSLRRSTGSTACCILLIGCGIGLTATLGNFIDALFFRKLPVRQPDQLVMICGVADRGPRYYVPYPIYERLAERSDLFSQVFRWVDRVGQVDWQGETSLVHTDYVGPNYYSSLGVTPELGRLIDEENAGQVAVISHRYWRSRFGGEANVIGKTIPVGAARVTIIGVTKADYRGPIVGYTTDLTLPMEVLPVAENLGAKSTRALPSIVMARLQPGVGRQEAEVALESVWSRLLSETTPTGSTADTWAQRVGRNVIVTSGSRGWLYSNIREQYSKPLWILLGMAGLVLAAVCANLAGLLLARGIGRRQEFAVRAAAGAGPGHLAAQVLLECFLLSAAGGLLALLIAHWGSVAASRYLPPGNIPMSLDVGLGPWIFGLAALLVVLATFGFGVFPALQASRVNLNDALKQASRVVPSRTGFQKALIAFQITVSTVLLVGAGLFVRGFSTLMNADLGFSKDGLHILVVSRKTASANPTVDQGYIDELTRRLRTVPGVKSVGITSKEPLGLGSIPEEDVSTLDESGGTLKAESYCGFPGFFEALDIPLLQGRVFTRADGANAPGVAIVNDVLSRALWPRASPVGQYLRLGGLWGRNVEERVQVVGVVKGVRYSTLHEEPRPALYVPCTQRYSERGLWSMRLAALIGTEPSSAASAALNSGLRREVDALGRQVVIRAKSLASHTDETLLRERMLRAVMTLFGLLALSITCFGLYALVSLLVVDRVREFGIRMALGAKPADVRSLILRDTWRFLFPGVAAGMLAAVWAAHVAERYLYILNPRDVGTFAVVILVLVTTATIATSFPVRRAYRTDPAPQRCSRSSQKWRGPPR
ncbi:MAG: FtsX-like permease family protein [bacterium]|nr:FtsX-like permease family protein [bacterium]